MVKFNLIKCKNKKKSFYKGKKINNKYGIINCNLLFHIN